MSDLREDLAALAYEQWREWMTYLLGQVEVRYSAGESEFWRLDASDTARWRRQVQTPYTALSEPEKDADRAVADKVLALLPQEARHG